MTNNQNIKIIKLTAHDADRFIEMIRLFEEVFSMESLKIPPKEYLEQLLTKPDFLAFVALNGSEVVGGLTAYTLLQYYSESPLVYIYDLAVKNAYQRKGIGKLLISAITSYSDGIGIEEVFVQAEKIDEHAIDFYRSTGAKEVDVLHFTYPLK